MLSGFSDFLEDCNLSSETQGQLVGAGKSLNGREKKFARRKVRLFPAPTNCPWVSEDDWNYEYRHSSKKTSNEISQLPAVLQVTVSV